MLYERWRKIAEENANEVAIHYPICQQRITFSELASLGESEVLEERIIFPQGENFIVTLLKAWRSGKITCPLEQEQRPPEIGTIPKGCAHLKMTSATSGTARMIAFTGEQLAADAQNIVETMGLRPEWPNLGVVSLAHSYGFSNLVLPLLLHGIPLIMVEAPLPEIVLRAANLFPAITLAAVPALWNIWNSAGSIPQNIRMAISAGAPLSLSLEQSILSNCGLKIHNFYGSSECGGIAFDADDGPRLDASCVGRAMNNVRLSVGSNGCLVVESGAVGETYLPESSDLLANGLFQTSDLAEVRDGKLFLKGRAGDQINVAGRKISPEEIEKVLRLNPNVKECLVFGIPSTDAERTEIIAAFVTTDKTLDAESLKQFLLAKIPAWQVPREWRFVDSLTANQRGKISRAEWRRKFLANEY